MLATALQERGHETVLTREPGGSPGAEEIRALVLEGAGTGGRPKPSFCCSRPPGAITLSGRSARRLQRA